MSRPPFALLALALATSCLLGARGHYVPKAAESLDSVVDDQRGGKNITDRIADPPSRPTFSAGDYAAYRGTPGVSRLTGSAIVRFKDGHRAGCDLAFLVPSTRFTQWLFVSWVHRGNATGREPGLDFSDVVPDVPSYLKMWNHHQGLVQNMKCDRGRFGWQLPAGSYFVFGDTPDHHGPGFSAPNYEYQGTSGDTQYFEQTGVESTLGRFTDDFIWVVGPYVVKPGGSVDIPDVEVVGHWALL